MLAAIGLDGQQRLCRARALIVGAGGLGCPAALFLATAGFGAVTVVDDDVVEEANLQRQILYRRQDLGRRKAEAAAAALEAAGLNLKASARCERAGAGNVDELIAGCDVVLDGTDNFATRHLLNRACRRAGIPLVSGAAEGFDGQVAVFDFGASPSPCYACVQPPQEESPPPSPCATLGVFAPLTGAVGSLMAGEAIKLAAGAGVESLRSRMLVLDLAAMRTQVIAIDPAGGCPVCAGD